MNVKDLVPRVIRCHTSQEIPGIGAQTSVEVKSSKNKGLEVELATLGVIFKMPLKDKDGRSYIQPALVPWTNVPLVLFEPIYDETKPMIKTQ